VSTAPETVLDGVAGGEGFAGRGARTGGVAPRLVSAGNSHLEGAALGGPALGRFFALRRVLQVFGHAVHFSLSTVRLLKIRGGREAFAALSGNALLKKADRQFQQFVRQNIPRHALGRGFRSGVRRAPARTFIARNFCGLRWRKTQHRHGVFGARRARNLISWKKVIQASGGARH